VILAIRNRRTSILSHPPFFRKVTANYYLIPAILFSFIIAIFFLYPKKFNTVLGTSPVPAYHWFIPLGLGMGVLLLDEARKYFVRKYPKGFMAKIAW
jgi:sodium/potassium-transporting ATPase subunit alpha